MRDVNVVNLSLMAKWKWRILQEELPLWKVVLIEKYGNNISGLNPEVGARWPRFASGWWKELMTLEGRVGVNWFTTRVVRKVSNGRRTSFWNDWWIGDQPLALTFPRVYSISSQKEAKVGELWRFQDGVVTWNLHWRRVPFVWEHNLIRNLLVLIERVMLGVEEDRWRWVPEEGGLFSVRSAYRVLEETVLVDGGLSELEEEVYANLWKSPAPSKVVAFSWMLLLDRIPTRANLVRRRVLPPGDPCDCVLCGQGEETPTHLFLHCQVTSLIWRKVLNWLGINFITPHNLFMHFACWSGEVSSRRGRKAFWLIWHASIWIIWKERNARIFKNQVKNFDEVVEEIKAVSWYWSLSRLRIASCLFYEWCWNPRECLNRKLR